ncbi:MAG TPA: FtsK/SpoIIIE domain-containing protein, partial [Thermomicrobiaceae bacterium]|nr:FtsK/SpoIIIE domain-containing protein [Thermomicrobiaceae bacterium]
MAVSFDQLIYIEFGLIVAMIVASGALLLGRKRRRIPVEMPALSADHDRRHNEDLTGDAPNQRSGDDGELGVALAEHLQRFLTERGALHFSVPMVSQSRKAVIIVLGVSPDEQLRLLQHCVEFTAVLRGRCGVSVSPDHDVVVYIPRKALNGLVKPPRADSSTTLPMIPIGQLPKDETLFVNWHELGHMLITGLPGAGVDVILTTLLTSLAARFTPEQLQIWTIADPRLLPTQLRDLPHHRMSIDSEDESEVEATLTKLRAELAHRMSAVRHPDIRNDGDRLGWPEILLVLGEIGEIGAVADDRATFDLLGAHGLSHGMRCVAMTVQGDSLSYDILDYFSTRLALQISDDDQSIKIMGRPDASQLGNGEFMLRLDHRTPLRARGFRIEAGELDGLIRAMHERRQGLMPPTQPAASDREFTSEARSLDQLPTQPEPGPRTADFDTEPAPMSEVERAAIQAAAETEPPLSSLIQIRCFGEFTVASGDREIVPSGEEGTSYKAWEVLAFLAAQPDGSIAKD